MSTTAIELAAGVIAVRPSFADMLACSRLLQRERRLNIGCSFRRINGTTIRYKMGDIAVFLESQPGGGGCAADPDNQTRSRPGRPPKSST